LRSLKPIEHIERIELLEPFTKIQKNKMKLEILTPEKKIYSADVYGVQLPGINGLFEVLDKHAPLVSALKSGTLKILTDKTNTKSYTIQSGFVEVLNNNTTVLIEGAEEK
jgi:F-type H+-transporting ATPase subunit epsilon